MKAVAHIYNDFDEKFGIPRQSGRCPSLTAKIVFEPEFRHPDALREIEGFSHLWLIFDFSLAHREGFTPTVRPPRLGGNRKVGVFASRSPFRPNNLGLSSVRLLEVRDTENEGKVLIVSGADLLNGTPIYDVKPYLPYTDCHTDARGGYAAEFEDYKLEVDFSKELLNKIPESKRDAIIECLSDDPRPSYQDDDERIYSMLFAGLDVKFKVSGKRLTVVEII
ncbi:MAG: tRNA (N6-threonylcarbamoyladenosine(37)-N6)-methyltransferase TrmO [Oscillospiraceae bacterium]|nr:tRNA (N6-threonylcarbamoyladenosine(37)-N6)-methyltransferase TrmO [Oscillospiraceae bacterium]